MRTGKVRVDLAERAATRAAAEATTARLGVGRTDRQLPMSVGNWIDRLDQASRDPHALKDLISCIAGPARQGAASLLGRRAIFDAAVEAAVGFQEKAIRNAQIQNQTTPDPDYVQMIATGNEDLGKLQTAAKAARAAIT